MGLNRTVSGTLPSGSRRLAGKELRLQTYLHLVPIAMRIPGAELFWVMCRPTMSPAATAISGEVVEQLLVKPVVADEVAVHVSP